MNQEQYKLICARRNTFNQLVWQVPALATASQAFLLTAAFNPLTGVHVALILAFFSLIVGAASIQLMSKHRHMEMTDSEMLMQFERANAAEGFAILHGPWRPMEELPTTWFVRLSSFRIWRAVLGGFCALALLALALRGSTLALPLASPAAAPPESSSKSQAPSPIRKNSN